MEKTINFDGYTVAVIKKRYANGDCLCDVQRVETVEKEEVITASDTDLILTSEVLGLTVEDLEILNPKPIEQPNAPID